MLVEMTQVFLHRSACPLPNVILQSAEKKDVGTVFELLSAPLRCLDTYPAFWQKFLHPEQRSERTKKSTTNLEKFSLKVKITNEYTY